MFEATSTWESCNPEDFDHSFMRDIFKKVKAAPKPPVTHQNIPNDIGSFIGSDVLQAARDGC